MSGVYLVVGLGNPGAEYQLTAHNAGFWAVDRIAAEHGVEVRNKRALALTGKFEFGLSTVYLAKPQTFMNASGLAVRRLIDEFGVTLENLLVVYDDLDLPLGTLRIRRDGRPGSHNGATSVYVQLRTTEWPRIRIGVGPRPGVQEDGFRQGQNYLLSPMSETDLDTMGPVLDRVVQAVDLAAQRGISAAMNKFNRRDEPDNNPGSPAEV